MARSAIREGFPLPYVHPISQHPSWADNSRIVHASLRRVQVFAFQSARIARVLAKHVAAIIACVLTHNLMRYRLTGAHHSCT